MSETISAVKYPFATMPLLKFCEVTGYTDGAIRQKIHRSKWAEGQEFCYDPDGRIHVIVEGYNKWVRKGASRSEAIVSESPSPTRMNAAGKH